MASAVIGALRVNLGIDTATFSKGLKEAQGGLKRFATAAKVGLGAVVAGGTAVALAVKGAIDAADEMGKASQKFGVPIQELSRLKHAAELSDVSFDALGTSLRKLSQNMDAALKKPTGEAATAFQQLGIQVKNADGSLRGSTDVLNDIAARFAAMPDGVNKTALAVQLFGRSGLDMIPMLNAGADGLAKMKAEADALGVVFTPEMAAASEQYNDNITRLGNVLGGIGNQIATALIPHLAAFTDWLVANAPKIVQFAQGMMEFAASVGRGALEVGSFVVQVGQQFAAFEAAIVGLRTRVIENFVAMKDGAIQAVSAMVAAIQDWISNRLASILEAANAPFVKLNNTIRQLYIDAVGRSWIPDLVTESEGWFSRLGSSFANVITGLIQGSMSWKDALASLARELAGLAANSLKGMGGFAGFFGQVLGGLAGGGAGLPSMSMGSRPAMSLAGNDNGPVGGKTEMHFHNAPQVEETRQSPGRTDVFFKSAVSAAAQDPATRRGMGLPPNIKRRA